MSTTVLWPGMMSVHRSRDRVSIGGGSDGLHFCPVCGKKVPTHMLVYDFRERKVAGYRCACGFIHVAGLDLEDLARMGWMEGYQRQCREMRV